MSDERPHGALERFSELIVGKPYYVIIPTSCRWCKEIGPALNGKSIRIAVFEGPEEGHGVQFNCVLKFSEGTISLFEKGRMLYDSRGYKPNIRGYIFTNFWHAYAYILKPS
jgi:hypothetical protein